MPTGIVCHFSFASTSSGRKKLFQLVTIARTDTVPMAGRAIGSRIRQKKPNRLQPSMIAASSSSAGIVRKKERRMMIVMGSANAARSEERRVGKECRSRRAAWHEKKKGATWRDVH